MKDKNTGDLRQELMESPDLEQYLAENEAFFSNRDAAAMLSDLFKKSGISKATLAKRSGMSEIYLHQIFSGRRNPSRSRLLCLCFGLGVSLEEAQELLKRCGLAQLYPRSRRDAIIINGLAHHLPLFSVNDALFSADEETLF